jgi:hypothetical protein
MKLNIYACIEELRKEIIMINDASHGVYWIPNKCYDAAVDIANKYDMQLDLFELWDDVGLRSYTLWDKQRLGAIPCEA